ncbi:hypothetical protein BGP77_08250 [Saccharospirillum sp. MSK14-1]|uniref:MerR family transcriptional regulator n=1 Tax=Saccharospirillum sp. MSK14-1 TaxID=1897632 RepID=UPI000D3C84E2|nr:MerR family transcriptional regulator [Saccharospirillum sp. MSK14-1]PTY35752.1 hypothetical protein BGP77_08250 [Saccharospirillum sp. MSK14-1]
MKEYSIGEVAKLFQISIRTLHHYDAIGLLIPTIRAESGYRFYTEQNLDSLKNILIYRALGISLQRIKVLLAQQPETQIDMLREQKRLVDEHIERLKKIQQQLEQTLSKGDLMMKKNEFSIIEGFDPDKYEQEVVASWGDTDAYKESSRRTKSYSKSDWQRCHQQRDDLNGEMVQLLRNGESAVGEQAINVAEKMRQHICTWYYQCSPAMHAQLAEMYVADDRFTDAYESLNPGLAAFVSQAIKNNLNRVN